MTAPVRIPADVDMHDRVLGPLTARQLAILAAAGAVLYLIWAVTRAFVPIPVFLAFAVPVGAASAVLALGTRDGVPMDKLPVAAIRQRVAPRHRVAAPEGVRPAPAWLTADADRTTASQRAAGARAARAGHGAARAGLALGAAAAGRRRHRDRRRGRPGRRRPGGGRGRRAR